MQSSIHLSSIFACTSAEYRRTSPFYAIHFSKLYKAIEVLLCAVAVSVVAWIVVMNDHHDTIAFVG